MNGWFNPETWLDIVSQVLLVLGAVSIAVVPSWLSARNHQTLKDVKNQVVNGHKSPLRADLDIVLERLDRMSYSISDIDSNVKVLRAELIDEEVRRRENVRELHSDLERSRQDLRSGMSHIERRLHDLERDVKPNG